MIEFVGDLIITSAGYISRKEDWGNKFDYHNFSIDSDLGFTKYLWTDTGGGDGTWKVSEPTVSISDLQNLSEFIEHTERSYYNFFDCPSLDNQILLEDVIKKQETVGRFCSDTGCFGVFLLDEVMSYRPDFMEKYYKSCYTIIRGFSGVVDCYVDIRSRKHLIGVGNKSFYTNGVSW